MDIVIVVIYLAACSRSASGARPARSKRLPRRGPPARPVLYTGTMAAVVLGGASTIGGVGLGYKFGISGMWLVVAIGVGLLLLSLFSPAASRAEGLHRRPDARAALRRRPSVLSGIVMGPTR